MDLGERTVEGLAVTTKHEFWARRRVFVTGHTGFKGGWLCLWLSELGAEVHGLALPPATTPNLFDAARIRERMASSTFADVRDARALGDALRRTEPEIVVHLAAQPLVRASYEDPVATFATNVMGTVNVLEAVRHTPSVRAGVIVTTDKCYENRGWIWPYRETDRLGGHDPYASSKACSELVVESYRRSFFGERGHAASIATARAGNVIGGGDWAVDRLLPDAIRAFSSGQSLRVRHPSFTRPWQHVLDPLSGYLSLAERLVGAPEHAADAWNFGPDPVANASVRDVIERVAHAWGDDARFETDVVPGGVHEARTLSLDSSKARALLGWSPRLDLASAVAWTTNWYRAFVAGESALDLTLRQIHDFQARTA